MSALNQKPRAGVRGAELQRQSAKRGRLSADELDGSARRGRSRPCGSSDRSPGVGRTLPRPGASVPEVRAGTAPPRPTRWPSAFSSSWEV